YLKLQNKLRLRRVAIEAKVLNVKLDKANATNLNVDAMIADAFNNQSLAFSSAIGSDGITRDVVGGIFRNGNVPPLANGPVNGDTTEAVITALSAISSKISVEYSGNLVTLSDQPAPLQVATKQAYVARVSGSSSETTSSTTLEPGTIDIG